MGRVRIEDGMTNAELRQHFDAQLLALRRC
jgi:hypothetical protein